jgi:hypothetical protein
MNAPDELFGGTPGEDEDTARLLRRALSREAEMVEPGDGMGRIRDGIGQGRRRPWVPWAAGVAAAAVAGLVVGAVTGLPGRDDAQVAGPPAPQTSAGPQSPAPQTSGAQASGPSASSTDAGTPDGGTVTGVPVYWLGESKTSVWLYREFRDVPDVGGPVASAVAAMTREKPADPDYFTPWAPATRVEVSQDGDALTVDLSPDAFGSGVGSEVAERAVQQLVYTATAAARTSGPVTVTVDGEPYEAWGVIRLGEPMQRAPMVDVQASTWVLSPTEGASVPRGTVQFTGYGTAFEGTVNWEVRQVGGGVVEEGFATGGSMGTFAEFAFSVELGAGEYAVEVYQPDVSSGESAEGPRMYPDTKTFTVE